MPALPLLYIASLAASPSRRTCSRSAAPGLPGQGSARRAARTRTLDERRFGVAGCTGSDAGWGAVCDGQQAGRRPEPARSALPKALPT